MSPLEIEILMHYYTTPGDYRNGDFYAPAVREAIDWMLKNDMLAPSYGENRSRYEVTDRCRAYIDALKAVPLPIRRWVIEWPSGALPHD